MQQFSRQSISFLTLCVCFFGVYTAQAMGGQLTKLEQPTGSDWFGFSTATDGNYVVVGDLTFDYTISQSRGTAIVYRQEAGSWVQDAMLVPDTSHPYLQLYGYSVAIDQDIIIVGAYYDMSVCNPVGDCSMGSASVFRREAGEWVFEEKLIPPGLDEETRFGKYVSLDNGRALVSAVSFSNDAGEYTGAIYVFRREGTNWVEEALLTPADVSDGSGVRFIDSAQAIYGDRLIVGATIPGGEHVAYVFHRVGTTWTEEAKLVSPDLVNEGNFGFFLDLHGSLAVIAGTHANAFVYALNAGVWTLDGTLVDPNNVQNSGVHHTSVNTDGLNVLVTTVNTPVEVASTSTIFQRLVSGWTKVSSLEPSEEIIASIQGAATDMKNGLITIGARPRGVSFDHTSSTAYIFSAPALVGGAVETVPAVTTWGIVIMALMLMTAATWIVRVRISMA